VVKCLFVIHQVLLCARTRTIQGASSGYAQHFANRIDSEDVTFVEELMNRIWITYIYIAVRPIYIDLEKKFKTPVHNHTPHPLGSYSIVPYLRSSLGLS